jgi:hypothetical protein
MFLFFFLFNQMHKTQNKRFSSKQAESKTRRGKKTKMRNLDSMRNGGAAKVVGCP